MSANENNQPSLIGGHAEYVKGATEAAIGNATGSHAWTSSGEQAKAHAVDTMKKAGEQRDSSQGYGAAEQKLGQVTGCEGMTNEGAASKKQVSSSWRRYRYQEVDTRIESLLIQRQQLTDELIANPYDIILYLKRALVYSDLGYPDLASGDAYRALLLTDEVLNDGFEYHEIAVETLRKYANGTIVDVFDHGALSEDGVRLAGSESRADPIALASLASIRCFQILALSLLLCGCLKSSYEFCVRGLAVSPGNAELKNTMNYIQTVGGRRMRGEITGPNDLPDWGMVRREVYPWNNYEPDRFSDVSLDFLNRELAQMAPKCCVKVSQLPILLGGASDTDSYEIIPTCNQLGVFAKEDIAPGENVLIEYSLVTANNRLKDAVCDACSSELPGLGPDSKAVNCPECYDTVFCDQVCFEKAQQLYHPAVCDKDVDSVAKDPEAREADETLHLLLLARVLAMAAHQGIHPLDVNQIKYIWGDFVDSKANEIDLSPKAGAPPEWTLPFSFKYNIETPFHILEKMDINIYEALAHHDIWVFNTLYSKFRGTASARKNPRDGRPDVAAVHPFWCLANHDCNPNVTWEWGGKMVLRACETRVVGNVEGGIKSGEEILNHYCDVQLPVQQRREWACGSLGGWCMCERCRNEAAIDAQSKG
ncbi:Wd tetratricopeptide repeat domain-containing protein [Astrocystis sublimbata]|nr:Wd tetratricopeptide repeat domain-containing protein [Astrocystis sublimbata]